MHTKIERRWAHRMRVGRVGPQDRRHREPLECTCCEEIQDRGRIMGYPIHEHGRNPECAFHGAGSKEGDT